MQVFALVLTEQVPWTFIKRHESVTRAIADGKALRVRVLSIDDEGEQQIYRVSVLKFGSGDLLCELEDCGLMRPANRGRATIGKYPAWWHTFLDAKPGS
jgi:hypothetical protein